MPSIPMDKVRPHPAKSASGKARSSADASGVPTPPLRSPIPYAELAVTTNYTFLTGASHPEEMVQQAAALGHHAAAITDVNTLAGIVRAHVAAKEAGIPLVVGCRLRLIEPSDPEILVYPTCRPAYARLCRLLTLGKRRAPKGECLLTLDDVREYNAGLLAIAVPGEVIDDTFESTLQRLRTIFDDDRLSLAVARRFMHDDAARLVVLRALSERSRVPLVATNDALYHDPRRRALQDVLACIRHGCTIHEAGLRLQAHAERHLKPAGEMHRLLQDCPGAIRRTMQIVTRAAAFSLDELKYEYPSETCPVGMTAAEYLRHCTWQGALNRYAPESAEQQAHQQHQHQQHAKPRTPQRDQTTSPQEEPASPLTPSPPLCHSATLPLCHSPLTPQQLALIPEKIQRTINYELALIHELHYEPYFLTCFDIVNFARSRGILCQGRGGAANSAVCYCLGITEVDPNRFDLLFERFISRSRNEPPDIDIDFEHERREEVIQYLYTKYGRDRAALTAEVISYRGRSAVREVGKAMGLSLDCVDALAKNLGSWSEKPSDKRVREAGLDPGEPTIRQVIELTQQIAGFPRHLSQHVGGFVITQSPLCDLVPIENAAMEDRTVIEWDKDDIDAMGMLKVDVLGLGMLTCVSKALRLVRGGRHEGTQARRHEAGVAESFTISHDEQSGGNDDSNTYVSRFDRLATSNDPHQDALSNHSHDAPNGAVRPDNADAASGRVGAVEHRGGLCETEHRGVCPLPQDREGLARRTFYTNRDRDLTRDADCAPCDRRTSTRNRPSPSGSHSQHRAPDHGVDIRSSPGPQPTADPFVPSSTSCLRASVPPCLASPSHLDTSTPFLCPRLSHIPLEDPAIYDMLCRADSVGVFQVESRAQMSMLPRLRPRCFYDLVIEVAIVRPGPIQGGMVHPYLRRRAGEEPIKYPSPEIEAVLGRTLGVPIFQEQAMKLAIVAGGFTPDEADGLRRAMAAWKRKGDKLHRYGERLISGMIANGYPEPFAQQCFRQIQGFSEYGFPESHAASFALIVYASAWLKRHHPAAFAAAIVNSQPMGFYAPAQLVRDAQEHGVPVRGVDVNFSTWDCSLEETEVEGTQARRPEGTKQNEHHRTANASHLATLPLCHFATSSARPDTPPSQWGAHGPALRLGMRLVKGLRQDQADLIAAAVARHGRFARVEDLWRASDVSIASLRKLAQADAFRSMGLDRQGALWRLKPLRDEPMPLFDQRHKRDDDDDDADDEPASTRAGDDNGDGAGAGNGALKHAGVPGRDAGRRGLIESSNNDDGLHDLPPVAAGAAVLHDYQHTGLSLKAHPLSFLRDELTQRGGITNAQLRDQKHFAQGTRVKVAGTVLVRQRPATASGVVFITLEDETGIANLIIWSDTFERFRKVARLSTIILAHGHVERQGEVVHVHVHRLESLDDLVPELVSLSRDFH